MKYFEFGVSPELTRPVTLRTRPVALRTSPDVAPEPTFVPRVAFRPDITERAPEPAFVPRVALRPVIAPAKTTAISREEIEQALEGRGYLKGAYTEISVPAHTRMQAIAMAVQRALAASALPVIAKKKTPLSNTVWNNLVNKALRSSMALAKKTVKTRTLTAPQRRGAIV